MFISVSLFPFRKAFSPTHFHMSLHSKNILKLVLGNDLTGK